MFVVIGTTTADLFVFTPGMSSVQADDGFRAGNLVFTDRPVTILLGGNGGNAAYVLAGLGAPVALCSAVGQDILGDTLVGWLEGRQVNLTGLHRSEIRATSSSTILLSDAAHQIVFHHLGATREVSLAHISDSLLAAADVLLIASFPLLTGLRLDGYAHALATTRQAGGLTAVDIGPAIGDPATLPEMHPLLPYIDYLIANTHELCVLAATDAWETAAQRTLDAGAACVVVKRGEQGASVRGPGLQVDVPAFAVEATLTVGAGDSFNAGFLYALRQGWSLEQSLRFGAAVAALVVSGERGVLASPDLSTARQFLHQ